MESSNPPSMSRTRPSSPAVLCVPAPHHINPSSPTASYATASARSDVRPGSATGGQPRDAEEEGGAAAPARALSARQERERFQELNSGPLCPGDTRYIVSDRWMSKWEHGRWWPTAAAVAITSRIKSWTGWSSSPSPSPLPSPSSSSASASASSYYYEQQQQQASWMSSWRHPVGRIDNSDIVEVHPLDPTRFIVSKSARYTVVSDKAWEFLHARYGGGPEIRCKVVNSPTRGLVVDPRPMFVWVYKTSMPSERRYIEASRDESIRTFKERICIMFSVDPFLVRLWNIFGGFRTLIHCLNYSLGLKVYDESAVELEEKPWSQDTKNFQIGTKVAPGLTGLVNMGNSCYVSSAIQCLSNAVPLREFFLSEEWKTKISISNPLGSHGGICEEWSLIQKAIWDPVTISMAPVDFFHQILCVGQFLGEGQQDVHEFLALVLDLLHEDLNTPKAKSCNRPAQSTSEDNTAWSEHTAQNCSKIVELFHGQLRSCVACPSCRCEGVTYEPFTILSVPLPPEVRILNTTFWPLNAPPRSTTIEVVVNSSSTVAHVRRSIGRQQSVCPDCVLLAELSKNHILCFTQDSTPASALTNADNLAAYEIGVPHQCKAAPSREDSVVNLNQQARQDEPLQKVPQNPRYGHTAQEASTTNSRPCIFFFYHTKERYRHSPVHLILPPSCICTASAMIDLNDLKLLCAADLLKRSILVPSSQTASLQLPDPEMHKAIREAIIFGEHIGMNPLLPVSVSPLIRTLDVRFFNILYDTDKLASLGLALNETLLTNSPPGFPPTTSTLIAAPEEPVGSLENLSTAILCTRPATESEPLLQLRQQDTSSTKKNESFPGDSPAEQTVDLETCIALLTAPEELGEDNPWMCPECRTAKQATKTLAVWKAPRILIVHLKRFTNWASKVNVPVRFPASSGSTFRIKVGHSGEYAKYRLFAVSNHIGSSLEFGHYTACARNPDSNMWYAFDDTSVSPLPEDWNESVSAARNAYVLFFEIQD
ncbi:peptidase C19 family protein [Pelomyxa schiedti]|nr:peptidase C19 family protein [Pelomyxa schiedti]